MAEERSLRLSKQDLMHGDYDVKWEDLELSPPYGWEQSLREEHHYYKDSGSDQVGALQIVWVLEKIFPFLANEG